jgi:hypothetical protein
MNAGSESIPGRGEKKKSGKGGYPGNMQPIPVYQKKEE